MARKLRVHYSEAVYHVIARGNNKQIVFRDQRDKIKYLDLIDRYQTKFDFVIYAYVLMENHLHLLIKVKEDPLAKIMQGIQLTFTKYMNKKYGGSGHVFEQRYKALICNDNNHLLTLIRYIHNNPVKAQLSEDLLYPWSSHKYYVAHDASFVDVTTPLSIIDENPAKALKKYLSLMNSPESEISVEDLVGVQVANPLVVQKNGNVEEPDLVSSDPTKKADRPKESNSSLDRIVSAVTNHLQIDPQQLFSASRQRDIVKARNLVIFLALENGICDRRKIADLFKVSNAGITRAWQSGSPGGSISKLVWQVEKILRAQ